MFIKLVKMILKFIRSRVMKSQGAPEEEGEENVLQDSETVNKIE